jgi:hypothetical protein
MVELRARHALYWLVYLLPIGAAASALLSIMDHRSSARRDGKRSWSAVVSRHARGEASQVY